MLTYGWNENWSGHYCLRGHRVVLLLSCTQGLMFWMTDYLIMQQLEMENYTINGFVTRHKAGHIRWAMVAVGIWALLIAPQSMTSAA